MAKNHMPAVHFGVRPDDVRAECAPTPNAIDRWRPELRARADAVGATDPFVINVLDVIGETWDGGVTSRQIGALLRSAGDREVIVNINSPGGDMFEGLAIYNMLRGHSSAVTVRVVGLAASAASIIAMAGDRVEMARAGFLMIHNAWVFAIGDRHELGTVAAQLGAFDETMADLYATRTGLDAGEIGKMMDRETWISGRTAVEQRFADGLLASDAVEASHDARAQASQTKTFAKIEAALTRGGMTRSERRAAIKALTARPSAGDDGMPGAAEQLLALSGWAKSKIVTMEK